MPVCPMCQGSGQVQWTSDSNFAAPSTEQCSSSISSSVPTCPICQLSFTFPEHLSLHGLVCKKQENGDVKQEVCMHCDFPLSSVDQYREHLVDRHAMNVHPCHLCPRTFSQKPTLLVHLATSHRKGSVASASVPVSGYRNRKDKKTLVPKVEQNTPQLYAEIKCSQCAQEMLDNSSDISAHAVHGGKPMYTCAGGCGKKFSNRHFLKKHFRLHTGEMRYKCGICQKEYALKQSFRKHMQYHSGDRPHKCPECGKCFRESQVLQNHRRIHSGEKPYHCDDCGKRFRQRVAFHVHRRIHTNEMPYSCQKCQRRFRYKVSFRSHVCVPPPLPPPPAPHPTPTAELPAPSWTGLTTAPLIRSPYDGNFKRIKAEEEDADMERKLEELSLSDVSGVSAEQNMEEIDTLVLKRAFMLLGPDSE